MSLQHDLEHAHHEVEAAFVLLEQATPEELRTFPIDRIELARRLFEQHFTDEELHLFPKFVARAPEQVKRLLEEHDLILRALSRGCASSRPAAPSPAARSRRSARSSSAIDGARSAC